MQLLIQVHVAVTLENVTSVTVFNICQISLVCWHLA